MLERFHLAPQVVVPLSVSLVLVIALIAISKVPLGYNVRNLLVRWRITVLTAIAFTLVVSLLTVMLEFVNGMTRLTENTGQPGNVMVLSDGATDELFSNLAKSDTTNVERQPGVERKPLDKDDKEGHPLCSKEVYIVVNQPILPEMPPAGTPAVRGKITRVLVNPETVSAKDAGESSPKVRKFIVIDDAGKEWEFAAVDDVKTPFTSLKVDERAVVIYEQRDKQMFATELRTSNRRRFIQVRGIEDARISREVHGVELLDTDHKWWSDAGVGDLPGSAVSKDSLPPVQAVLGEGVARLLAQERESAADKGILANIFGMVARLFGMGPKDPTLSVGDTFELGPRKWVVTGIMKSAGSAFGSEIWAKHSVVGPMFGKDQFTCLVVRTKDAGTASSVAEDLRKNFKPAVRAEPETEYYSKLSETNKQFSIAIYFVAIIMAIGGIFGVMNTMFAAISQRIKDIGVLRILGFTRWQILISFFLETLVIALLGGLLGCAIGYLFDGTSTTSIVSGGQGGGKTVAIRLTFDAGTLSVGILFTLIMGALGGLIPSLWAMRLRPLESLR